MPQPAPAHNERVLPGPGGWAAATAFAAILGVALWPVDQVLATGVAIVALVVLVVLLWWTSPVVAVGPGPDGLPQLRAGRATVPTSLLGTVTVLDAAAMSRELGPTLDARAYVCLRSWARTGVRIELNDPADPTPYWLVSTRHAPDLAASITQAVPQDGAPSSATGSAPATGTAPATDD